MVSPDPEIQGNSAVLDPSPSSSPSPLLTPRELPLPSPKEVKDNKLPPNFPKAIPIYTEAKLLESQYRVGETKGETRWQTEADRDRANLTDASLTGANLTRAILPENFSLQQEQQTD